MRVREAKDFLVNQVKQQAALGEQPLSELEIQMLSYSEGGAPEQRQKLADEFDELHDAKAYEQKISQLMNHAYKRLRKEDRTGKENWDLAIRCLRKGDHYILVMWGGTSLIVQGIILGLAVLFFALVYGFIWIARIMAPPDPHLTLAIFLGAVILVFVFQRQISSTLGWIVSHTIERLIDDEEEHS
jgi:hypothetical protein